MASRRPDPTHLSTNPGTRGSCGSTSKSVLATRCAVPAMIGTTPSAVSSSTRARKRVPMIGLVDECLPRGELA